MANADLKPGYQRAYTVLDYYDGPRKGVADFRGKQQSALLVPIYPAGSRNVRGMKLLHASKSKIFRVVETLDGPRQLDYMRPARISLLTDLRLNRVKHLRVSTILDLPRFFQLPPIALQALREDWIIFTVRLRIRNYQQPMWLMLYVWCCDFGLVVQKDYSAILERTTPVPAISFRPERQRCQIGRPADRRPCVGVLLVFFAARRNFLRKIDKQ